MKPSGSKERWLGGLLMGGAVILLAAALIPDEMVRPLGDLIRRSDDVSPERLARGRQLAGGFSLIAAVAGLWLFLRPDEAARQWRRGREEPAIPLFPPEMTVTEGMLLALIALVTALLRGMHLQDGMAYDEAYTFLNFARRPWYEAIGDYNSTNNHLLNTLLMHFCYQLGGSQEWVLRLPVFIAGCLLPLAVWRWGRDWGGPGTGLIAAAGTAIAPALITYSVDARGYILVTLAAVVWDTCLGRLHAGTSSLRQTMLIGIAALTAGLCSMPIMVYALLASSAWFLLVPTRESLQPQLAQRVAQIGFMSSVTAVLVAAFYGISYIFRGVQFLRDPIMQPTTGEQKLVAMGESWRGAWDWWTAGAIPPFLWAIALAVGLILLSRRPGLFVRLTMPFVAVLLVNVLREAAPPPRIYLWLIPWVCGLAAVVAIPRTNRARTGPALWTLLITLGLLAAGGWYAARTPILIYASERTLFPDVREIADRLQMEIAVDDDPFHRLAAPLPIDLPSIFYRERAGRKWRINEQPQANEQLWLITRYQETLHDALTSGVVQWREVAESAIAWELVAEFPATKLYRSRTRWESTVPEHATPRELTP